MILDESFLINKLVEISKNYFDNDLLYEDRRSSLLKMIETGQLKGVTEEDVDWALSISDKYSFWILNLLSKGKVKRDQAFKDRLTRALNTFARWSKGAGWVGERDIRKIQSLEDLEGMIARSLPPKEERERVAVKEGTELIAAEGNNYIYRPLTVESAQYYLSPSPHSFCIKDAKHFGSYTEDGDKIYIIYIDGKFVGVYADKDGYWNFSNQKDNIPSDVCGFVGKYVPQAMLFCKTKKSPEEISRVAMSSEKAAVEFVVFLVKSLFLGRFTDLIKDFFSMDFENRVSVDEVVSKFNSMGVRYKPSDVVTNLSGMGLDSISSYFVKIFVKIHPKLGSIFIVSENVPPEIKSFVMKSLPEGSREKLEALTVLYNHCLSLKRIESKEEEDRVLRLVGDTRLGKFYTHFIKKMEEKE